MIRSSKTSLKFSNTGKLKLVSDFINEYKSVTQKFVDVLWPQREQKIPSLIPKNITDSVDSWLSQRAIQCSAKQASGIVRGTLTKQKQRLYRIEQLVLEGKFKYARKLKTVYDKVNMSKPEIKNVSPELDSRFIKINLESDTSFDGWVTIASLGNKMKFDLPFKKTSHFNRMLKRGTIKQGIRLSKNMVTFNFEIEDPIKKTEGSVLGIDIGVTDILSCSNGIHSQKDNHGHSLASIQQKLSRRKKGSFGFKRAQDHRNNYINWSINRLNLIGVKQVNIENIKNLRYKKHTSRYLSHFTYTKIFDKLEDFCFEQGVLVKKKSPVYTSQRCSKCGWVRKSNRKGKIFKCDKCGYTCDADLNASQNIAIGLPSVSEEERLLGKNRKGFYFCPTSQEPIVPDALKTKNSYIS